jgi:formylglycine-generating enzyme required for sulfatase activity
MHYSYIQEKMERDNCYSNMQVVFVDIASYSRRRSYAQLEVIKAFMKSIEEALVSTGREFLNYTQKIDAHLRHDVIVLPSGDGAAIGFPFDGAPNMHLFFAGELLKSVDKFNKKEDCQKFREQGWCNCHGAFLLRCGISEGKLIIYKDLNGNFNLAGDVINMAARVMGLADASQVFLTHEAFCAAAEMIPDVETKFRKYRKAQIKHGLRIDVYQYIDDCLDGLDVTPRGDLGIADDTNETNVELLSATSPQVRLNEEYSDDGITQYQLKELRERMVQIPAGEFIVGNELIGHADVKISKSFLVDKFPTTQSLYLEVMGRNPSRFVGMNRPVDNVSWLDAIIFCNKLSELSGLEPAYDVTGKEAILHFEKNGFRLPTEYEWEYCCCGGKTGERYGPIDDIAWYSGNAGGETQEVGKKAANGLGLYDMLGNVWEWCNDWYQRGYSQGLLLDYEGPDSGLERVLRGGSWNDLRDCIRSSYRHRKFALSCENTHGFRVVLPLI